MCSLVSRLIVLCFAVPAVVTPSLYAQAAASPALILDAVTDSKPLPDGIEVQAGPAVMRITASRDDIIRVRIAPDALPEDASWAVLPEVRSKSINVQSVDESSFVGFRTAALEVRGYSRARRPTVARRSWSRHDLRVMASALAIVAVAIAAKLAGAGGFQAYPTTQVSAGTAELALGVAFVVLAAAPFVGLGGRLGVARA